MTEREFAIDVVRTLQAAGHRALWAGGCVRDERLGLTPADYDVATDAVPEQVQRLFRRSLAVGAAFGVIEVLGPRGADGEWLKVQVATFRSDGAYTDGRRPDEVTFSSPEEDAQRRDFTINGLFFDPCAGEVIDYVGGRADLAAKVLRAIGDPHARFGEDKLRLLRAARMAARFDLAIDPATRDAARAMAGQITVVSAERIADELRKMFAHPNRVRGLELLDDFGLLAPVLPDVARHPEAWPHTLRMAAALGDAATVPLVFAVLLRTNCRAVAVAACRRLRLSNDDCGRVGWLIDHQNALAAAPTMPPSRLYPLLVHPGVAELLAFHQADAIATGTALTHVEHCERLLRDTPMSVLNPVPLVTGDDLIAAGWKPGPRFKFALDHVRAAQLDGCVRTRAAAMALAGSHLGPKAS